MGIRGGEWEGVLSLPEKTVMEKVYARAFKAWNAWDTFRSERDRCKRYVYGDQWEDIIEVDGIKMREKDYIWEQGQKPLKNNILRRILRNVVGVYRSNYKVPVATKDEVAHLNINIKDLNRKRRMVFRQNRMEQLAPRLLEEFLISGMAVVRISGVSFSSQNKSSISILPVTPNNFFCHSEGYDPRGIDTDLIGEVHNVSFHSLMKKFCHSMDDIKRLESIYGLHREMNTPCKVLEVWYRDTDINAIIHDKKKSNIEIKPLSDISKKFKGDIICLPSGGWRCFWFSYDGVLLKDDGVKDSHPYVWKAYPFIDGEVHSYISDLLDQQHYVNHLITLYDFIMKSSAKGVLLFPDESLPRGMSLQEVADEWSRFNGVIPYRAQPGIPLPTQVSGNAANIGIKELLNIQMQMLEDISGVSPTLQGKLETTAASGTLFAQQNRAAMTSLLDVISSFEEFVADIAGKFRI